MTLSNKEKEEILARFDDYLETQEINLDQMERIMVRGFFLAELSRILEEKKGRLVAELRQACSYLRFKEEMTDKDRWQESAWNEAMETAEEKVLQILSNEEK